MSQETPKQAKKPLKQREYEVHARTGVEISTIEKEESLLEEAAKMVAKEITENLKIKVKRINKIEKTDFEGKDIFLTINLEDLFGLNTAFETNKKLQEICQHLESKFPDLRIEYKEVNTSFRDSQIIVKLRRQGAGYREFLN